MVLIGSRRRRRSRAPYEWFGSPPPPSESLSAPGIVGRRARTTQYAHHGQQRAPASAYEFPRPHFEASAEVAPGGFLSLRARRRTTLHRKDRAAPEAYGLGPTFPGAIVNAPSIETAPVRGIHIADPRRYARRAAGSAYLLAGVLPDFNPDVIPPEPPVVPILHQPIRTRRAAWEAYTFSPREAAFLVPITAPAARGTWAIMAPGRPRAARAAYELKTTPAHTPEIIPDVVDFHKVIIPQHARGPRYAASEAYWFPNTLATPTPIEPEGEEQPYIPTFRPRRRQ